MRTLHVNRATRFGVSTLGAVAIPANDTSATPTPQLKWINVANEGEYKGHHQGEFALTPEVLQQLVDNLHNSPQYASGPVELTLSDGTTSAADAGTQDVVQFDYEHASEMAPWEGSIPSSGAPAIGWVRDLEVRKGDDGRLQLWALAWLGDQIRGQIDRAEYKWVSIAWNPAGIHWVTGEPIGAVLTSIAFTNHPYLQDLESLAAANRAVTPSKGGDHGTPRAAGQPRKPGVDSDRSSAGGTRGSSTTPPVAREREPQPMPPEVKALLARLCSLHGLQVDASYDSIIKAAENASTNGGKLNAVLAALGVSDATAALAGIPELMAAKGQIEELLSELNSLMSSDAAVDTNEVAPQDVAQAMSSRGWVRNGMADPVLQNAVHAARKASIDAALAAVPRDPKNPNKAPSLGAQRLARAAGRAQFLASYGVNQNPGTQHLGQTFVAGPGAATGSVQYAAVPGGHAPGVQLTAVPFAPVQLQTFGGQQPMLMTGAPPAPVSPMFGVPPLPGNAPAPMPMPQIDWIALSGRNLTEKVCSYLSSVDPNFKNMQLGAQISKASEWKRANPHLLPQAVAA